MGRLQEEGFDCYLKDEYTVTIDPILSNAIGGIKLCVNSTQLERAKECIAAFEEAYRKTLACPRCHSNNVQYISKPGPVNWINAIFTWLLGSYALSTKEVYHCFNCGYEFDESPEEGMADSIANL